ncbi:MAG TPA: TonB-dependent receptor [Bryobacteraceae bacterium]|nr:TonB-dependent receptor [Bryobacteraceae bacterium]
MRLVSRPPQHASARFLLVSAAFLLSSAALHAQYTSSVEGTVTDSSGAIIPNAMLTLRNVETGITNTATTSTTGYFRFPSLPSAPFRLSATAVGFKTSELAEFRVQVGETKTVNLSLEVGAQATVVSVTGDAPLVEASEGRVSAVIEGQKLADLPLVGRNFYSLVVLTPGVTGLPTGGTQAYSQNTVDVFLTEFGVNMNAGGTRAEQNRFSLDSGSVSSMVRGGVVNVTPNSESVQELRVAVNNFSAEYGAGAGAGVTAITKSGTNALHGAASWFHTNNQLQARNVFSNSVPVFRRNEWVAAIGGPIVKNRTFFFASVDVLRSGVASNNLIQTITPEFLDIVQRARPNGIATKLLKDYPADVAPDRNFRTAGDILGQNCAALASPSTNITTPIGAVPCNTRVSGEGLFGFTPPRDGFQWNARVDHQLSDKDRLFVSFYKNDLLVGNGNVRPAFRPDREEYTAFGQANWTRTFSANVLNELSASVLRVRGDGPCSECQIPSITVTGSITGFGNGGPTIFVQNNYQWRDVLSWNTGGHSFKMGGSLEKWQSNFNPTLGYQRPNYTFQNIFDFANDDPQRQTNIGFNPENGSPWVANVAERQQIVGLFVQDNWKIRPNLSLTFGLRWEHFGVVTQPTGMTNVEFRTGNDLFSRIADGKNVMVDQIFQNPDNNNFAPRFSFAWDPTRTGNTSIRGGYGLFYDIVTTQLYGGSHFNPPIWAFAVADRNTPPFLPIFGLGANASEPYNFPRPSNITVGLDERNGLRSGLVDITWIDPSMRNSYTHNYFFGIQHSFASNWMLEGNYVGSSGHKLYGKFNLNRVNGDLLDGRLDRRNPSFGAVNYAHAPFNSSYNGANFSVKKRFGAGLSFDAAYTIGKAIDYLSGFTAGQPVDVTNWNRMRGLADFHVGQKLAVSLVYHSPELKTLPGALRAIAGDWQIGSVTILQSGSPFTVTCNSAFRAVRDAAGALIGNSGCDYNADGTNFDVPNAPTFGKLGDLERSDYITGIFQASDFPVPSLGQQGNLGRNTFFGPGYANTDLSLMKNFKPWGERFNAQFRAEAFNLFNRVNLLQPVSDLANASFGRSTGSRPGRNLQFGVRLSF